MINILSFDVEDWPQSTLDFSLPVTRRVVDNTARVLDLCGEAGVTGTFFVLGLVAESFPDLVARIRDAGHEVASHGHDHRPVHAMTPAAFRDDLRRSRTSIEQAAGTRVLGYRAPDFSISRTSLWALVVLAEEGYAYDSSLFPFSGPRYGVAESFAAPCQVQTGAGGLVEFPLTTTEWLGRRWPAAGGGYFRLLPHAWHRAAIARLNRGGSPATSYFHPYETDTRELRSSPHRIPLLLRLSQGLGRSRVAPRLRLLLGEFRWGPARDHLPRGAALTGGRTLDLTSLASSGPLWRTAADR
jgi:polysaccharide deacetylase family protein (PEP-CTERM system associated)